MKYKVIKQTYSNELIEETEMNIEEIEKLAISLIGDVFKSVEDVNESINYIEENGEEGWLCNNRIHIVIEKIRKEII